MIRQLVQEHPLRRLPRKAAEVPLVTPTSLYLAGEATGGNLVDQVGANHLTESGTPSYRRPFPGGGLLGAYYDGVNDNHSAAVLPFGVDSVWMGVFFDIVAITVGVPGICGRSDAALNECAMIYTQGVGAGWPTVLIRDNGANSLNLGVATDLRTIDTRWFAQLQIDRAAAVARSRWSPLNRKAAPLTHSGSIAGFASLDSGDEFFGLGDVGAFAQGMSIAWAAVALGAQCQGAGLLQAMAVAMGVE